MSQIRLKLMVCLSIFSFCFACCQSVFANSLEKKDKSQRQLVIVTIDGLRWQEVFSGADLSFIENQTFTARPDHTKDRFWNADPEQRRLLLMPFLNTVIAQQGVLIGDRSQQSYMHISNQQWFSYPGYNEIFTGFADPNIRSNAKKANPNITFLEWLNNKPAFNKRVAIFSGWDVFPEIYNRNRSGLIINAGFEAFKPKNMTGKIQILNQLQEEVPSPWHNVRHDAFTFGFAMEYLQSAEPRVLVINLGETDDFAHNGKYDAYLDSAHRTDAYLHKLWLSLQSMPDYKNNTNMLVITDHGRGDTFKDWQHHASPQAIKDYMNNLNEFPRGIVGADHIWFGAIGPDIADEGLLRGDTPYSQNQFAATALAALGFDVKDFNKQAAEQMQGVVK